MRSPFGISFRCFTHTLDVGARKDLGMHMHMSIIPIIIP